ncbi:MAG: hypothetical protein M1831_004692 [Alyxoria varia]|nr:MAG: hypothetical protein M1831_004692 [Alyxoria varia]
MTTFNGKCHCGQTEWTVKLGDDTQSHILCHCDTCKFLSGSAYTLNQIIPRSDFSLTKGKLNTYAYKGDSGKSVNCYYCPNCTSHAYHHQEIMGPDTIVARTVLLDKGKSFQPGAEIYGKAKMSWEPTIATTHETLPP